MYDPLEVKITLMENEWADNPDARSVLEMTRREIDLFRKYSDSYGYQVFLLRNTG